ncbi:MAG TPA: UDP-N-acetylmuramate--L-alanine ligase [Deltaproteobacteria bacterium]|nr:UDP-N-acetylmuramate--L-alanine ligase [Deltaproteobacteria bacterium]
MYRGRIRNIHFIGIGGVGMSGIAEVLINMGYAVSGSDLAASKTTDRLASLGARIFIGHRAGNVHGAHCVVYSSAVRPSNAEMVEAADLQIPIIPRAEMLAELMRMKYAVAIAGTHGKTTTTSMVGAILGRAGLDPTIVTGGRLNSIGTNARLGGGDYLVAEADESDGSFLKLTPTIAVVTSIDAEHMDHYRDMEEVRRSYLDFMNKVPFYGCAVICLDHPVIQGLIPHVKRRVITYGLTAQADMHGRNVVHEAMSTSFELCVGDECLGRVRLGMPGTYNVYNALAAAAVARELEVDFEDFRTAMEEFAGVERRFQIKGEEGGVMVVDDYGHHPVEIRAVLAAAKSGWSRRVVAVFQPHRFTRTRDLYDDFITAFNDAERLILTEVYPAGEEPIEGVSGRRLYEGVRRHGHKDAAFVERLEEAATLLADTVEPGDMVITLGAGNVWTVGEELLRLLRGRGGAAGAQP